MVLRQTQPDQRGQGRALALSHSDLVELLTAHSSELICLLDLNNRFIYASPSYESTLGFAPDTLIGTAAFDLAHPDDQEATLALWQTIADQNPLQLTFRHRHSDGSWHWLDAHGTLKKYADTTYVICVARDITERKRAEQERERLLAEAEAARAEAEAARRENEASLALLDTLFTTAPIGLGFFDRQLRYARLNQTLAEINGVSVEEHLGKTVPELLPQIPADVFTDFQHVLEQGKPVINREVQGETPAMPGTTRTWLASFYPVFNGESTPIGVGAVVSDITDQKQAEIEQRKLVTLVQNSADLIAVTSLNGEIEFMNAAGQRLVGFSSMEEARGTKAADCVPAEDVKHLTEHIFPSVIQNGAWVGELRMRHFRTGEPIPVMANLFLLTDTASGQPIGFASVTRDMRERKREEERQQLLVEASAELGRSLDYEETLGGLAKIAVRNFARWCAVSIVDHDDQFRTLATAHATPESETPLRQLLDDLQISSMDPATYALRNGRTMFLPDVSTIRTAGTEIWQPLRALGGPSLIAVPFKLRERLFGGLTFTSPLDRHYTDDDKMIAEELANRAALAIENAELYQNVQAAVGIRDQFLSIASHELKTPLTSLLGNLQLLQRRLERENKLIERDSRTLGTAIDQTLRLNRLIGGLLDISRLQRGQFSIERKHVDICALVARVVDVMQPTFEHHTLSYETPATPLLVSGDTLRLEQVLENLIHNAAKYSPSGGPIKITVGQEGAQATISVHDHGMGIPAEALPHVFNRFYRAPNAQANNVSGMGIGLFIVREIVTLHGGTISAHSTPDNGSTFTVTLPLAPPKP